MTDEEGAMTSDDELAMHAAVAQLAIAEEFPDPATEREWNDRLAEEVLQVGAEAGDMRRRRLMLLAAICAHAWKDSYRDEHGKL